MRHALTENKSSVLAAGVFAQQPICTLFYSAPMQCWCWYVYTESEREEGGNDVPVLCPALLVRTFQFYSIWVQYFVYCVLCFMCVCNCNSTRDSEVHFVARNRKPSRVPPWHACCSRECLYLYVYGVRKPALDLIAHSSTTIYITKRQYGILQCLCYDDTIPHRIYHK